MSEIRTIEVEANGLTFRCLEQGSGPLVLCLPGFPDYAWTFRHQLAALSERGFRVVAPFMRGYAQYCSVRPLLNCRTVLFKRFAHHCREPDGAN